MKKDVVADAGVLISLTSSCLDNLLYHFSEKHNIRFIIPPSVENEAIVRPIKGNIRKYLFSALRLQDAVNDGVLEVVDAKLATKARRLMEAANHMFYIRGKPLKLIHDGESEMLVLAKEYGIEYILIDERTTRMLIEAPLKLKKHLEEEFRVNVMVNKKNLNFIASEISPLRALRTSELIMLAYEDNFFKTFENMESKILEAALYKAKYSGCSISFREIKEYMKEVR